MIHLFWETFCDSDCHYWFKFRLVLFGKSWFWKFFFTDLSNRRPFASAVPERPLASGSILGPSEADPRQSQPDSGKALRFKNVPVKSSPYNPTTNHLTIIIQWQITEVKCLLYLGFDWLKLLSGPFVSIQKSIPRKNILFLLTMNVIVTNLTS